MPSYALICTQQTKVSAKRRVIPAQCKIFRRKIASLRFANVDALQDVLKGINFNRKIGQRTLDDDTLSSFVQKLGHMPDLRTGGVSARLAGQPAAAEMVYTVGTHPSRPTTTAPLATRTSSKSANTGLYQWSRGAR